MEEEDLKEDKSKDKNRMEAAETETEDEMCVNENEEDSHSSGETAIVSDGENKGKETGSQSDSYENICVDNEKDLPYTKKTSKPIEKQSTNFKPKPNRSLSSQSASSTLTSTLVGMQNGKKISSASGCSQDFTNSEPVRLTGYLEKRSKMLGWKKFWCVLDGRLLTYYKSKSEYESLSACCGSINLGIASTVRPIQIRGCKGFPLQIVTRTQVYYLRSLDKATSDHWLIAIQEAASSCPKIPYPVWADPGKQFFRYSFAALSQWSLNTSSDDISSTLNHLPPNFNLKNDRPQPLMQKCHSFTSLQSPVVNCVDKISSKDDSGRNNSFLRRGTTNSNSIDAVSTGKVRHSTSMLALESSPQAGELKRELTRKLSVGSTMAEKTNILIESFDKASSNLVKSSKQAVDKDEEEDDGSHHYDEILDFEGANYEPCGKEENANDNDIYEQVETVDDPWEKLDTKKIDLKVEKRNNSGIQVRGCPNRNSLVSISEAPEDIHNSKGKNMETIPEQKSQWKNVSFRGSTSDEDSSNCSSIQNLSNIPEKSGKRWKSIGGFFQKMFHKEKSKKNKDSKSSPMVITGPVDLRSRSNSNDKEKEKEKPKKGQAPAIPTNVPAKPLTKNPHPVGSQLAINNENVMDELKKKVGKMKRQDSEGNNSDLPSSKSSLITTPEIEPKNTVDKGEINSHPILQMKKSNDSTSSSDTNKPAYIPELLSTIKPKKSETETLPPVDTTDNKDSVAVLRESQSDEFQVKLAKFNRLSQKLSTSFAAVLNPVPANPTFGYIGRSRSCRFQKQDETLPPLPPKKKVVPGKVVPIYDVPPNNRPVSKDRLEFLHSGDNSQVNSVTIENLLHKVLAKKNSAPEMTFSSGSSRVSGESESFLRSSLRDSKTDEESVFEEIMLSATPPPRPPKSNINDQSAIKTVDLCQESTNMSNTKTTEADSQVEFQEIQCKDKKDEPTATITEPENIVVENNENTTVPDQSNIVSSCDTVSEDSPGETKQSNDNSVTDYEETRIATPKENCPPINIDKLTADEETVEPIIKQVETEPLVSSTNSSETSDTNILEEIVADPLIPTQQNLYNTEKPETSEEKDILSNSCTEEERQLQKTAELLSVSLKLSPTASNKSVDIDCIEILSDYSDLHVDSSPPPDSPPPVPFEDVQNDFIPIFPSEKSDDEKRKIDKEDTDEDIGLSIEEIPEEEASEQNGIPEKEHIYENIKFATIQTIVQELETVEENEDEMSELYDDFPFEFSTPSPQFKYGESPVDSSQNNSLFVSDKPRLDSIRHSGIDQLQAFLNSDVNNLSNESMTDDFDLNEEPDMLSVFPPPPPIFRTGAVSRLGHSSAINQLQRIAENN